MSRLQNEKEEEEEEEEGATYYGGGTDRPTHALTPGSSRNIKGEKQKKERGKTSYTFIQKQSMVYLDNETAREKCRKGSKIPRKTFFISLARQKVSKVSPLLHPSSSFAAFPQGNGQKIVDWGKGGKRGVRPCGLESGIFLRGRTKKLFYCMPDRTV